MILSPVIRKSDYWFFCCTIIIFSVLGFNQSGGNLENDRVIKTGVWSNNQLTSGKILVNRYKIIDTVGIGGMGAVYRARDLHFPNALKIVAVKEMVNSTADQQTREQINKNFERESNILVSLNHHAIPTIYDFFILDEKSYLVEEYINGQDLDEIMRRSSTPFKEEQVITWAIEICDVLDYLHHHKPDPVIFRDIKPSNIMINVQNHVVLVDFGIAKNIVLGQKGTMIGTEGFSPPEQYRGEATPQTDIYALGATMHTLLTRRDPRLEPPFSFKDRPIREINSAVSMELETIIYKALEYNTVDRYRSASEFKTALISVARRTGALPFVFFDKDEGRSEGREPLWVYKCEDEIRGSPTVVDGMLYVGSYDHDLHALNANNGDLVWRFHTDGGIVTKPLPVEGQLVFGSEDGKLYSVAPKTGFKNWEYKTEGPIRCSPNKAEGHVYFGSDDRKMYAYNLGIQAISWTVKNEGPVRSTPFLSISNLFYGTEANEFLCVDYRGKVEWHIYTKKAVTSSSVVKDGIVYFSSLDGFLYALDARTGWVFWRYRMEKGSISSPAINGDYIYVGSVDGNIYCIEKSRAQEVWRYKTGYQVTASPVIKNDILYCGSVDGQFYALDAKTGRLIWSFSTLGPITGNAFVTDKIVYFGSHDHHIYAIPL